MVQNKLTFKSLMNGAVSTLMHDTADIIECVSGCGDDDERWRQAKDEITHKVLALVRIEVEIMESLVAMDDEYGKTFTERPMA